MSHKEFEQLELTGGELERDVGPRDVASRRDHHEIVELQDFRIRRQRATEQSPNPGEELVEGKRLDQIVVRAGVQPLDTRRYIGSPGEHQDRQLTIPGAQATANLDAV